MNAAGMPGCSEANIKSVINSKSIVYTDTFDKVLEPNGINAATWWAADKTYNPDKLTESMTRLNTETDYSIYLYSTSSYVDVNELNAILKRQNLILERYPEIRGFYKLEENVEWYTDATGEIWLKARFT